MMPFPIDAILHTQPLTNAKPRVLPHCGILEGICKATSLEDGSFKNQGYLQLLWRQPDSEGFLLEIGNWVFQISISL